MTLGDRVQADFYNVQLYRGGKGWLPAHLDGMEGDASKPENAVHPAPGGSDHPALRLFLEKAKDGQGRNVFRNWARSASPRWWKLSTPGRIPPACRSPPCLATAEFPFLVEWIDPDRAGRVLLCAVPLMIPGVPTDQSRAFVPLAHELVYYLAGARSAEFNLEPGQPLRYRLDSLGVHRAIHAANAAGRDEDRSAPIPRTIRRFSPRWIDSARSVLRIEGTRETGVYRLKTPEGGTVYYVVRPKKAEESDLTPCNDEDRAKVAKLFPA